VSGKEVTTIIIWATLATLIIWDIVVANNHTAGDTISEVMLRQASSHPIIAFALGVLVGHLLWPQFK
jgi:hypothetical protein